MSAIAERIDNRLRQLSPQQAAALERIIVSLLDMFESDASPSVLTTSSDTNRQAEALAALNRIVSRGGIAGIHDASAWQQEQRIDRVLPGR